MLAAIAVFTGPLIYVTNKEAIDSFLQHTNNVVSSQVGQIQDLASQHTNQASKTIGDYAGQYSAKAQEYMGVNRSGYDTKSPSATSSTKEFPSVPSVDPSKTMANTRAPPLSTEEPLISH